MEKRLTKDKVEERRGKESTKADDGLMLRLLDMEEHMAHV